MPKLASNLLSEGVQHCGLEVRRSWCTCWRHAGRARYVSASAGTLGDGAQHRCDRSTSARLVGLQLVHGGNAIKVASKNLNMAGAPAVVHCSTCHVVKSMTTTARRRSRNLPLQAMSATLPMACAGKFGARCGRLRHAKGLNFGPVAN